jgi:hypothetical protein
MSASTTNFDQPSDALLIGHLASSEASRARARTANLDGKPNPSRSSEIHAPTDGAVFVERTNVDLPSNEVQWYAKSQRLARPEFQRVIETAEAFACRPLCPSRCRAKPRRQV